MMAQAMAAYSASYFGSCRVCAVLLVVLLLSCHLTITALAFTLSSSSSNARNALWTTTTSTTLQSSVSSSSGSDLVGSRRVWLTETVATSSAAAATAGLLAWGGGIEPALASGGATAGKYTTIPIAKRRYYGRVQQAVHEFLEMGPEVVKGDMTGAKIQTFFDPQGALIVAAKRKDVSGQCTKKDGDCRGKEIRDSRYNDMKASMYLLGNAFRTDQQKPPDRLPTVRAAKAFFARMDEMEKRVAVKKPRTSDPESVALYTQALDILDKYLDLVELPPTDSGHYDKEFDTLVGETARIT